MTIPYGQRLITDLIDARATAGHERPYASIPRTSIVEDGFRDISYGTFANAINRAAGWLMKTLLHSSELETIAYVGPSDLRYHIFSVAAAKAGFVMFFPSPRNTAESLDHVFEEALVSKIITGTKPLPAVAHTIKRRDMTHVICPDLDFFLDDQQVEPIHVTCSFAAWRFRPWILLHTSGSTGLPKIVPIKHGMISAVDSYHMVAESNLMPRYGNMRVFIPFPPFHIAGINFSLPIMCWVDSTAVLPPADVPLTPSLVHAVHTNANVQHSMLAPSLVADLVRDESYLSALGKLDGLTFSGGPLSQEAAGLASQKVKLYSSMGATEYGGIPMRPKDPEDYAYFRFNERLAGLEFRESEQPGLFEMVFVRRYTLLSSLAQAIFVTFPEIDEYRTKDCYSKHPAKPDLWKYETRLDDVIVLSNGEKLNPIPMEGTINTCPLVKGCLVAGHGRFQAALLIERRDFQLSDDEFKEVLSPYIDRANKACPTHGRVAKGLVWLMPADKHLARAPKGTVQRAKNNALFKNDVDELFDKFNQQISQASNTETKLDLSDRTVATRSIRAYLSHELGTEDFSSDDDFFAIGIDSLSTIGLLRALNASRPEHRPKYDQMLIYDNSTVEKLVIALLASNTRVKTAVYDYDSDDENEKKTWLDMERVYQDLRVPPVKLSARDRLTKEIFRSSDPPPIFQPDGGTSAWLQVLGSFLINMNNWGIVNSFGVFQSYYEETLLQSYTPSTIAWIGTLQGALLLLVGIVSGPLFDTGYFRIVLLVAITGVVLGMMTLSLATEYYQIMLAQGVLIGLSLGLLYIPSVALVPLYFKNKRGLALGLATAGGSVGGIIYPIVFTRVLDQLGFGWACRLIGFIALGTLVLSTCLIKPVGARTTGVRQLFDSKAFEDIPFVTFLCSSFIIFCGVLVPFFLVSSFANTLTTDSNLSFYCATILNAAQLVGRVLPAALSDFSKTKYIPGPEMILLGAQIIAGVLGFCWIAVTRMEGYIIWLCFYGFFSGMNVTLAAVVLPHVCPNLALLGTRLGMLYAMAGIGLLISGPVAFAVNQSTGGFLGSKIWTGASCIVGSCFYAYTAFEARRRRILYETRHLKA